MRQATQMIDNAQLRQFAPLGKLSDEDAQELLRTSITVQLSPGTPLFNTEESDNQLFYLIKGKIELQGNGETTIIEAGSKQASQPLGQHLPGQENAIALEASTLISFDADMLDLFLNWTNPNAYVVNEMASSQDHEWLNRMLKSHGLLRFSEQQINTLLERMNEVHFNKGDVVISQDDKDNDYFYIIKQGRAIVSRKPSPNSKEIRLADLCEGDAFGEEAILTGNPRGATVTMEEPGNLMRLSKQDFAELLASPMLETISWDEAQAMVAMGATFLDIRLEDEFNTFHIPGSINAPLPLLRLKLKQLKQRGKYIIYCDDGSRSSVAAFLLNQNGFDAYILDGGMTTALPYLANQAIEEIEPEAMPETENGELEAKSEKTKQGNEYCSLADYWGATVAEAASDEGFADSDAFNNVEKSRLTPASSKPVASKPKANKSVTNKDFVFAELKHASNKIEAKTAAKVQAQLSTSRGNRMLRNAMLAFAIIGIAAGYATYQYMPAKQDITSTPVVAPVQNSVPTPTTVKSKTVSAPPVSPVVSAPMAGEPQPLESEPQAVVTDAMQMDAAIEADFATTNEELLSLQPTTPAKPVEKKAPAVDPATRGFIE